LFVSRCVTYLSYQQRILVLGSGRRFLFWCVKKCIELFYSSGPGPRPRVDDDSIHSPNGIQSIKRATLTASNRNTTGTTYEQHNRDSG
jgi:hypothetical protein